MYGVLLLIISLLGRTAAQQTFDSMERPLFEVGSLLHPSSHPPSVMDQHLTDPIGLPIQPIHLNTRPFPSSPPLPPQSSPQPPLRPPPQIFAQQIVPQKMVFPPNVPLPQQPSQSGNSPRVPFNIEFPRQPLTSNSPVGIVLVPSSLGVLNRDRIHVEGFQSIDRRFASTKRRRSPVIIGNLNSEDTKEEEFLPVEPSGRKLSAVELFDHSESEVVNDVGSDGSGGDFQHLSRSDYISSTNLRPESGYQVSATRLSNGFLKFQNTSNIISRVQQEEAEEESNSILDQEGGSGFGQDMDVSTNNENAIEAPLPRSFHTPVEVSEENKTVDPVEFGTTEKSLISNSSTVPSNKMTVSTVDKTTVVPPSTRVDGFFVPTASPNSVPFVRDSKMLRIVKEYAGLIVGCILGIPAIVVLCYFLYLKRLKRYTGTLDVSPRQRTCYHEKSERRKTICSEENELAGSPSTSTSKTPQPPPFPNCKKYVP